MRDADFWIGWSGAGGPPWGARTSRGWSPGDWREPDCGAAPTASGLPAPFSTAPPDATAAAFPVEIPAASPRLGLGAPPAEGPPDASVPFPAPTIRVNRHATPRPCRLSPPCPASCGRGPSRRRRRRRRGWPRRRGIVRSPFHYECVPFGIQRTKRDKAVNYITSRRPCRPHAHPAPRMSAVRPCRSASCRSARASRTAVWRAEPAAQIFHAPPDRIIFTLRPQRRRARRRHPAFPSRSAR